MTDEDIFEGCSGKIDAINYLMQKNKKILQEKFNSKKAQIELDKKQGITYKICPSCDFEAFKEEKITDLLKKNICQVCEFSGYLVEIDCPNDECRKIFRFLEEEYSLSTYPISCSACGASLNDDVLLLELTPIDERKTHRDIKHGDQVDYLNCVSCESENSGVDHYSYLIYSNCIYITKDAGYCDRCGQSYNFNFDTALDCPSCYAYFLSQ